MRKAIAVLVVFIFLAAASCNNGSTDTGTAPMLTRVFVHNTMEGLTGSTEVTAFTVGQTAYFLFTVTDPDLDATTLIITYKSGSISLSPNSLFFTQLNYEQTQAGSIDVTYSGTWEVSAYCVDAMGNRSNTVTRTITVS
jgi:hypothetical protein